MLALLVPGVGMGGGMGALTLAPPLVRDALDFDRTQDDASDFDWTQDDAVNYVETGG